MPVCRASKPGTEKQQDQAAGQEQQQPSGQNLAHQMSREQITEVQKKLNEMGYHAGNVDGQWGPETQAAIKNFQRDKQLEVTGALDQKTAEELGVDIEQKQEQQPGVIDRLREGFQGDNQTQGQTEGAEQGNK